MLLKVIHKTLLIVFFWFLFVGFLIFQLWPNLPNSKFHWLLLILFGPPLYGLGELFFGWLFSAKHGYAISERQFSIVRILIALAVTLVLFAIIWLLSSLLTKS